MSRYYSGESSFRRVRRIAIGAMPATGADWSVSVPAGRLWEIVSITASLATSGVANNREVDLTFTDGSTFFLVLPPAGLQAASLSRDYTWFPGASDLALGLSISQPMPEMHLSAGYVIAPVTVNLDAGDIWEAPTLWIVETSVRGGDEDLDEAPEMVVEIYGGPAPSQS